VLQPSNIGVEDSTECQRYEDEKIKRITRLKRFHLSASFEIRKLNAKIKTLSFAYFETGPEGPELED
jgi:hypothetical protein